MSDVNHEIYQQALVAVIAAAQEQGMDPAKLIDRASEILNDSSNKALFISERDVEHVELELSLAFTKIKGLW
ncbi:hypothetical protein PSH84_23295 [Pseudomonas beijingensis]|uniref:hypothetical protein n=1 Tax=Pseudomonas beijingensis TaxID=2954101 RepID=UPI002734BDC4|nr:hypothetical protein [Pseudomonas sp. FP830]WLI44440.1 hypothetical protein PSH84_23295 [Pseudomonas sp. FP830]